MKESEYDDWKFKGQKNYKAQEPKERDQYNQKEKGQWSKRKGSIQSERKIQ
jgi:hypothetical protein